MDARSAARPCAQRPPAIARAKAPVVSILRCDPDPVERRGVFSAAERSDGIAHRGTSMVTYKGISCCPQYVAAPHCGTAPDRALTLGRMA